MSAAAPARRLIGTGHLKREPDGSYAGRLHWFGYPMELSARVVERDGARQFELQAFDAPMPAWALLPGEGEGEPT